MVFDHHKTQNVKFRYQRVECPERPTGVEGQYSFYILECADNSLYCGSSLSISGRIKEHESGKAAKWTRERRPVQLVYFETYSTLLAARRRELQVKGWAKKKKENLILGKWFKLRN